MNTRVARSLIIFGVVALALLGVTQVVLAADGPPVLVSTAAAGMTEDGVSYGREDILAYYDGAWFKVFDGSEYGLSPIRHNVNSIALPWIDGPNWYSETLPMALMTFSAARTSVPDIPVRVFPQDVVAYYNIAYRAEGGATFSLTIDGSDIGLNLTSEAIDGLSWYPTEEITDTPFFDYPCPFGYFAISTLGTYVVPTEADGLGGTKVWLKGSGSDVLLFCPTELGYTTRGYWFKLFDSFAAGITPRHAVDSISLLDLMTNYPHRADGDLDYLMYWALTGRRHFTAPGFEMPGMAADPSDLVWGIVENEAGTQYSGFYNTGSANGEYPRLNGKIDALDLGMYNR